MRLSKSPSRRFFLTMRPQDKASPGQTIPWTNRALNDTSSKNRGRLFRFVKNNGDGLSVTKGVALSRGRFEGLFEGRFEGRFVPGTFCAVDASFGDASSSGYLFSYSICLV
jgi:hypothetical protein